MLSKEVDAGVFTTLSPTARGIDVGGRRVLLSDTVGFISRLPPFLIEAFKSTLEEVTYAAVVLLLVDASQPVEKMATSLQSCLRTLSDLEVSENKILTVMNKVDLVSREELHEKLSKLEAKETARISARTGEGLADLLLLVKERISEGQEGGVKVEAF